MKTNWLDRRIAAPGPYLTLCTTEAEYKQALKECGVPALAPWIKTAHADASCHYLDRKDGNAVCVICIRVTPERNAVEIAGLLVHEAVHVVQDYFQRIGECAPAVEQQAYAIQAVSQELMAAYSEKVRAT